MENGKNKFEVSLKDKSLKLDLTQETTDQISRVISDIFGVVIHPLGMISDYMGEKRIRLLDKMRSKTQKLYKERSISSENFNKMEDKKVAEIIEAISLEENETIQDMWAKLIVNASNPNFEGSIQNTYIKILKELEPIQAKILKYYYEVLNNRELTSLTALAKQVIASKTVVKELNISDDDFVLQISILEKLGVISMSNTALATGLNGKVTIPIAYGAKTTLTPLGYKFVEACM